MAFNGRNITLAEIKHHNTDYRALQTDGRTDRRHHDANSRSCSVVVRSAKMVEVQAGLRFEVDSRICFNNPARRSMNIGLVDER